MDSGFTYHGAPLQLLDHPYNKTRLNERGVEIPVAEWWLARHYRNGMRFLEIGNVLGHYFPEEMTHHVVDRYEEVDGVENADVFDVDGEWDVIIAISTIEHVRWDPPEPRDIDGAALAISHLYGLLAPGGEMLVTVPFGSNPGLDYAILSGEWGPSCLARQTVIMRGGGTWRETPGTYRWELVGSSWFEAESIWWERYGKSTPWADAVWIGEFRR